jgi:6-phosphogluconolactonase
MEGPVRGELLVFSDLEELSHMAASFLYCIAGTAIAYQGRFTLAISGGSTPKRLYFLLGTEYREKVQWDRVEVFWVDERCVPEDHEESNYENARELFLSNVPVKEGNIHRIRGELPPDQGALRYEEEIRACFGSQNIPAFDLIILGMGQDGHTASLFPGSSSLKETGRLALPVHLQRPETPERITLTLPVLNNAEHVLFLVSGPSKAGVIRDILEDEDKRDHYPAGLVNPTHGDLTWLIDREAASKLRQRH